MREQKKKSIELCLDLWELKSNPFHRPMALTGREGLTLEDWAGPKTVLNRLRDIIEESRIDNRAYTILLMGDYGSGKTHTLRTIQNILSKNQACSIYITLSGRIIKNELMSIVNAIGYAKLMETVSKVAEYISNTGIKNLEHFLTEKKFNRDFAKAMNNFHKKKDLALTWSWLTGNATENQASSLGFKDTRRKDSFSRNIVTDVIKLLTYSFNEVVIIFDEFERIIGGKKSSDIEEFRKFIDEFLFVDSSAPIGLIFSVVTPTVRQAEITPIATFLDRFSSIVKIPNFSIEDTRKFTEDLFKQSSRGTKEIWYCPPFRDSRSFYSFIEQIHRYYVISEEYRDGMTPRRILRMGSKLLLRRCLEGGEPIGSQDVRRIIVEDEK